MAQVFDNLSSLGPVIINRSCQHGGRKSLCSRTPGGQLGGSQGFEKAGNSRHIERNDKTAAGFFNFLCQRMARIGYERPVQLNVFLELIGIAKSIVRYHQIIGSPEKIHIGGKPDEIRMSVGAANVDIRHRMPTVLNALQGGAIAMNMKLNLAAQSRHGINENIYSS